MSKSKSSSSCSRVCIIGSCRRRHARRDDTFFKLHRFPEDKKIQKLWICAIKSQAKPSSSGRSDISDNDSDYRNSFVCSDHFTENDYLVSYKGNRVVKSNAVPSLELVRKAKRKLSEEASTSHRTSLRRRKLSEKQDDTDSKKSESPAKKDIEEGIRTRMLEENMDESKLKFYTGFTKDAFSRIFNEINLHSTEFDKYLDARNQLVMTLIKYKEIMSFSEVSLLYGCSALPEKVVSEIFIFWTIRMAAHFKKIDFWMKRDGSTDFLTQCTLVMDVLKLTVKPAQKDDNLEEKTFKYLLVTDRSGLTVFCSNVYVGTKKDRTIFLDTELIDKFTQFDVLLMTRKFQTEIDDILLTKNVNISTQPNSISNEARFTRFRCQTKGIGILDKGTISSDLCPIVSDIVLNVHILYNNFRYKYEIKKTDEQS